MRGDVCDSKVDLGFIGQSRYKGGAHESLRTGLFATPK